jgi:hypothetical protein
VPAADDIPLEPPLALHRETVPAVEDRSYLLYAAAALTAALAGGFLMAIVLPLAATGAIGGGDRVPWFTQAHGWVQLQGWTGLFVAGMAVRLIPRFAGRKPVPRRVTMPLLVLLVLPVAARMTIEPFARGGTAGLAAKLIGFGSAPGLAGVAIVLLITLTRGRRQHEPWRYLAFAGATWWLAWAALAAWAGVRGGRHDGLVPATFDDTLTWVVVFGAIANFIWAVQSRSVPIFFGRKTPPVRRMAAPALLLNGGAALLALSLFPWSSETGARLSGAGLLCAGVASAWLPVVAGAVGGKAKRLRPRARAAGRFVLAANIASAGAGIALAWAGGQTLLDGEFAGYGLRDAARHALGLGLITMLILGMARLVAPVFALERVQPGGPSLIDRAPFWLLLGALTLRVSAGLLYDDITYDSRMHLAATAGVLAWLAIGLFAFTMVRAVRAEKATQEMLRGIAERQGRA